MVMRLESLMVKTTLGRYTVIGKHIKELVGLVLVKL
jgi:hypothetical protein